MIASNATPSASRALAPTSNVGLKVLYEDNHAIAVVKPHGMLVQGDDTGDVSLMDEVKAYLKEKYHKPGDVFLGLIHRLDRPVGGIVIFGKTSKGAARLSEQFREHTVEKTYVAMVEGCPKEIEGDVVLWLKKNETTNHVTAFQRATPGALRSELSYKVLTSDGKRSLVEVKPKTGRPHQIRVSMQHLGCPIVGDKKYGARTAFGGNIALFASALAFAKPVGGERVVIQAKPEFQMDAVASHFALRATRDTSS